MKKLIDIKLNLFQKKFFQISLKNALQVMLRFFLGMLNIKIISEWLGTSGMVLIGQFNSFTQVISNLSGVGIQQGVTKLCAQYSSTHKRRHLIIGNSLFLITALSALTSLIVFLFSTEISLNLLHSDRYVNYIKVGGLLAFSTSFNNVVLCILNGFENYRIYIKLNISFAIITFLTSIPLTYWLKINGAIMAMFIASAINSCVAILYSKNSIFSALKHFLISRYINKRLLGFGLMLIIASSISPISSILIRNIIIEEYSINMAGWWEGVSRISKNIFSLGVAALSVYYLPQISRYHSGKDLNKFIWNSIKITMPIILAVISTVFLSKKAIVYILFSPSFKGMENLFLFQNIGDVIRLFNWFFAINFIIREKIRLYVISEIIMALIYYLLIFNIIPLVGIEKSTLPYMINNIIYLFLSQFLYRKYII